MPRISVMDKTLSLSPNPLVRFLGKHPEDFTLGDILRYIEENGVKLISFKYPAQDGRLKSLDFTINDRAYLEEILTMGERVDGSSLFPAYVQSGKSDLYVVPRLGSAFADPFSQTPMLDFLCCFLDGEGKSADCDPSAVLFRAVKAFRESTGYSFEAMAELEYYVISPSPELFPGTQQRSYHESAPFVKHSDFRLKCMEVIASCGGRIKYGHSEVGYFTLDGKSYEQNEIEFLPCPAESAADQILVAKWIIRNLAWRNDLDVTFAPKIIEGEAGSGMHIHMRIMDGERNLMSGPEGTSALARRAIAGMMTLAPSITAFGNKNPTSFLRLVPHQEAPTNICWGDSNRSALVRVPLGWRGVGNFSAMVNPLEASDSLENAPAANVEGGSRQTVEMRSPDGSADVYQLMAGLCVACRIGLEMNPSEALELARRTYVAVDIHRDERLLSSLATLPSSCAESADALEKDRALYEARGVFPVRMIDGVLSSLRAFGDADLRERVDADPSLVRSLVEEFFHCG